MHALARRAVGAALLVAPLAAAAHHAEGYATPQTIGAAVLAGFAHPAIELGQVAFLIALGALCARWPTRGSAAMARFVAGSAFGVLLAACGVLAEAEPLLPLALLGIAAALAWHGDRFVRGAASGAAALTVLAGLVHGQAAIEPVVGAPVVAFLAYAAAMLVAQVAIVLLARAVASSVVLADEAAGRRAWNLGAAACVLAAVAVAMRPGLSVL
jgi:hypothetical protein